MKERPILFSGPMVRAILEGRKTQTRRVVKFEFVKTIPVPENSVFREGTEWKSECPFGVPGDRLWVRERWQPFFEEDTGFCGVRYAAGGMPDEDKQASKYLDGTDRWRPSIHMPRWASRLTLEITAVRVERLQDITEEDAKAEGCEMEGVFPKEQPHESGVGLVGWDSASEWFQDIWTGVYGEDSWDANPYVWVVEFRNVEDKR